MGKELKLKHGGKEYTLGFNRKAIELLEQQGYSITTMGEKPYSTMSALFAGAFYKNHRGMSVFEIEKIMEDIRDPDGMFEKITDMYQETIEHTFTAKGDEEKNGTWEASW